MILGGTMAQRCKIEGKQIFDVLSVYSHTPHRDRKTAFWGHMTLVSNASAYVFQDSIHLPPPSIIFVTAFGSNKVICSSYLCIHWLCRSFWFHLVSSGCSLFWSGDFISWNSFNQGYTRFWCKGFYGGSNGNSWERILNYSSFSCSDIWCGNTLIHNWRFVMFLFVLQHATVESAANSQFYLLFLHHLKI